MRLSRPQILKQDQSKFLLTFTYKNFPMIKLVYDYDLSRPEKDIIAPRCEAEDIGLRQVFTLNIDLKFDF